VVGGAGVRPNATNPPGSTTDDGCGLNGASITSAVMLLMRPVHVVDARCLRQRLGCRRRRRSVRACERACYYLPFALLSVSRVRGVVV